MPFTLTYTDPQDGKHHTMVFITKTGCAFIEACEAEKAQGHFDVDWFLRQDQPVAGTYFGGNPDYTEASYNQQQACIEVTLYFLYSLSLDDFIMMTKRIFERELDELPESDRHTFVRNNQWPVYFMGCFFNRDPTTYHDYMLTFKEHAKLSGARMWTEVNHRFSVLALAPIKEVEEVCKDRTSTPASSSRNRDQDEEGDANAECSWHNCCVSFWNIVRCKTGSSTTAASGEGEGASLLSRVGAQR